MFKFGNEQKVYQIGKVRVGGQPGELPTVMIGSIFYHGHKIVQDEAVGKFDRLKAEELLKREEEASSKTGNPRIIDIVGSHPQAMIRYMDFVAEVTDSPFLLDGITAEVRVAAARHAAEVGLSERSVYNTIGVDAKPEEVEAIKTFGTRAAVLLAFNPKNPTVEGRMEVLKGSSGRRGLVELAAELGVDKPLADVSVLDVPDVGPASRAVYRVKEELGLPAGCAPANAIDMWRKSKALDSEAFSVSNAAAHVFPITMGANFIMYGPISRAEVVYPAVGIVDALVAYAMRQQYKIRPLTKEHPLYKIL